MRSIVIEAENTAPRFSDVFIEYAQDRGFLIDAARVRTPTDYHEGGLSQKRCNWFCSVRAKLSYRVGMIIRPGKATVKALS